MNILLYSSLSEQYIVQIMNIIKNNKPEHFEILRKIEKKPDATQRELAKELGFSLGKLNYCLAELRNKGLIKIQNFQKSEKKIKYLHILTPAGMTLKKKLIINFMKIKIREYDELKIEFKKERPNS